MLVASSPLALRGVGAQGAQPASEGRVPGVIASYRRRFAQQAVLWIIATAELLYYWRHGLGVDRAQAPSRNHSRTRACASPASPSQRLYSFVTGEYA